LGFSSAERRRAQKIDMPHQSIESHLQEIRREKRKHHLTAPKIRYPASILLFYLRLHPPSRHRDFG
jgi:hypothetical protein